MQRRRLQYVRKLNLIPPDSHHTPLLRACRRPSELLRNFAKRPTRARDKQFAVGEATLREGLQIHGRWGSTLNWTFEPEPCSGRPVYQSGALKSECRLGVGALVLWRFTIAVRSHL